MERFDTLSGLIHKVSLINVLLYFITMQKLINVLALSSFLVSAAVVGSGVYLFTNKDALIEKAKNQVMESITDVLPGSLVGGLSGALVPNPTQLLPSPSETLTPTPQYTSTPALPFSPF